MKKLYLSVFFMLLSFSSFAASFIDGFEDIPLPDGLHQRLNDNITFGNEESGYTEATLVADKKLNFSDIIQFYTNSLPQLGWRIFYTSDTLISFLRESDILEISLAARKPLKITISLKSKN